MTFEHFAMTMLNERPVMIPGHVRIDPVVPCVYCHEPLPTAELEPIRPGGNLACKSFAKCSSRQVAQEVVKFIDGLVADNEFLDRAGVIAAVKAKLEVPA